MKQQLILRRGNFNWCALDKSNPVFKCEAWFRLTGYRDTENNMYWSAKYPVFVHGESLCDIKVHV